MDITTILFLFKFIAWTGGVFISIWIIKLLREINSKQKEYIILIEKSYQEREKTRDNKIELLDLSHKKEIELIEREKKIFFNEMESEKRNLESRLSNTQNSDSTITNNLISKIKADLSLVVSKVSNLNILAGNISQMIEIVGIAADINRKINFISNDEIIINKQEKINIKKFILETFQIVYSDSSFQLLLDESLSTIQPILFNKGILFTILTEIFSNARKYSTSENIRIYSIEHEHSLGIIFENTIRPDIIGLSDSIFLNKMIEHDNRSYGLKIIKEIMKRYHNEVNISSNDEKFQIELYFRRNYNA